MWYDEMSVLFVLKKMCQLKTCNKQEIGIYKDLNEITQFIYIYLKQIV